jgi:hypothetical protein
MLVFGVSASCSGSGRWGMLSFVLSATCFYVGHGRGGNTPSRLAFRAREGGDGGGVLTEKLPPPSRVLSEGGVGGGVLTEETPPPSHISSEGGGKDGGGVSTEKLPPPV